MKHFNERLQLLLLAAIVLVNSVSQIHAQVHARNPLSIESALKTRSFGQLSKIEFSPDGKWISFTLQDNLRSRSVAEEEYARTGLPTWAMGTDVCLVDADTGKIFNLTGGEGNNWLPAWSDDGSYLAFVSDRDSKSGARLWVWSSKEKLLRPVSETRVRADMIEWIPGSHTVILTALRSPLPTNSLHDTGKDQSAKENGPQETASGVLHYESPPPDANSDTSPAWDLDRNLKNLCLIDIETGSVTTIARNQRISFFRASPDGLRIAYTSPRRFERAGSQQILYDLEVFSVRARQTQRIADDLRLDYDGASFSWSPDSQHLAVQTGGPEDHSQDCFILDLRSGSLRKLTGLVHLLWRRKSQPPLWDKQGHLYLVRDAVMWKCSFLSDEHNETFQVPDRQIVQILSIETEIEPASVLVLVHDSAEKQDGVYRVDLTADRNVRLIEQGQCYTCGNLTCSFARSKDGRQLVFVAEDYRRDQDLWITDSSFTTPRRLTHLNPQFDEIGMGSAQLISWLGDDGDRLQGTLLLPAAYELGKKYPMVVWIYGGAALSENFNHFGGVYRGPFNMQLLATRGYVVFMPDAPQHLGTPMFDLAKTVLPGINKVIEMGIADADRLAIIGHSYGGYSTLALLVQTTRFKAAIAVCGFGDLLGNYASMSKDGASFGIPVDESGQGLMGGTPWQFRSRYIENSPFFYLDRVETPLLLIQGGADTSVPAFLADQVFVGLHRLQRRAAYVKYEGEEHSPLYWNYSNQVDMFTRIIAWLQKYLGGPENSS